MKKLVVGLALILSVCAEAYAAIPESERNALLAIYNGNNGPAWAEKTGWNGAAGTECGWSGVTCDDAQTTVVQLYLAWNQLSGALPASAIAGLPNLEQLDLSGNFLTGQIPVELTTLTKLKGLTLEYEALTGPIPSFIGTMTNLTSLDFYSNKLTGPVPPELGNLARLQTLNLGWNQLSGPIPVELSHLSLLTTLDLDTNALTGQIPSAIGQLRNLQSLALSINQLQGAIPHEIGNLTQLTELLIAYNQLSGPIPDEVYTLRQLKNLGLEGNALTGPISPAIANLTALTQLDLNTNQLSGPIPAEITSLGALTELNLQENTLTGTIPANLSGLTSLVTLDLGSNQLTGPIPPSLGSLSKLENLALYDNKLGGTIPDTLRNATNMTNLNLALDELSGPIPDWIFQFPKLDSLYLSYNAFSGPLPSTMTAAVSLEYLDLSGNQIGGSIPSDVGKMQKLVNFWLSGNELSGPIPDSLWTITTLNYLDLSSNLLTGSLPAAVRNLTNLTVLFVKDNKLSGPLPPELGSLAKLDLLDLGSNEFTGTLPPELGQLKKLESVDFGANNFRSPVPPEIMGMTGLLDTAVDFSYNALTVTDPTLLAFMNRVQFDHDFQKSQTVLPANITVGQLTDRSAVVSWTPIQYWWDDGGYRVFASLTPNGPPAAVATTASKEIQSITVRGLQPSTTYYFTVATVSHPHDFQHNLIVSDVSAPTQATTAPKQLAPADVVLTATPTGLVELDGVPQNEDSFTLTNFGDAPTAITLELYDPPLFYDVTPKQFTLAGGAAQTVKVTAIPNQPAGIRYGGVVPRGDGTSDDDIVTTTMLSAKRSGGVAIAEPLTNRIEIASAAGINPVGQVTFRNKGTAMLVGVLVSDQPWLVPNNAPIFIEAGTSATVGFQIVRARRPGGIINGALTGTLSLVYVGELPEGLSAVHAGDTTPPPSVSISKVTVVDISKPDVGTASAPGLGPGEVAYYAIGLLNRGDLGSSLASGLTIVNAFGSKPVNDVRLYYTSASEKAVATLSTLGSSQGVSLANVVSNVYNPSDQIGSVQVRSADWQNLIVNANFLRSTGTGTLLGDLPVFRSDRALLTSDKMYLTGIAQPSSVKPALVLEEIAGTAATVPIDFLDSGGAVAQHRDVQLPAFATSELTDIPPATATIVVTNTTAAPTGVLAYVRMSDDSSGDTWSIVDWSRAYKYKRSEAVRLPLVMRSSGGGKRRAVKQSDAASSRAITSASLFNSGATEARVRVGAKDVTVPARQTVVISDVGTFVGATSAQSVVIEPKSGEIVVTSRISSGGTGTSVPVVPSQSGLRVGQSQVFSGLEDSAAYRTDYGFVETGGASTTIRATLLLSDAHSLFSTVVSRDFTLGANGFVYVNELVKSVLGDARGKYGDLHNLQLQLDVVDGTGSVLPFVTTIDNATGDTILRLE